MFECSYFQIEWFQAAIKEAVKHHYKDGPYPFLAVVTSGEKNGPDDEMELDHIKKAVMKNPKLMPRGLRFITLNQQGRHECHDANGVQ